MKTNNLIGTKQVSEIMQVSYSHVYNLEKKGIITPAIEYKQNGRTRRKYNKDEVKKATKKYKIVKQMNNNKKQDSYKMNSKSYEMIVKTWNNWCNKLSNLRSKKFNSKNIPALKKKIKKIIRLKSKDYIEEQINSYFECCKARKHIINGKTYSYSTLCNFLERIFKDLRNNNNPHWWNEVQDKVKIEDKYPRTTQKLANLYAQYMLGKPNLPLHNPSKEYQVFKIATDNYIQIQKDTFRCGMFNLQDKEQQLEIFRRALAYAINKMGDYMEMESFASKRFWEFVRESIREHGVWTV